MDFILLNFYHPVSQSKCESSQWRLVGSKSHVFRPVMNYCYYDYCTTYVQIIILSIAVVVGGTCTAQCKRLLTVRMSSAKSAVQLTEKVRLGLLPK